MTFCALRIAAFAILACAASTPSLAADGTAQIRTGEHAGFTRIVVEFDSRPEWTVGRVAGLYALRTAPALIDYDLSDVFNTLSAGRLSALEHDPVTGDLLIDLGCNCRIAPFEIRANALVLDIHDGPPRRDDRFARDLPLPITGIAALFDGPVHLLQATHAPETADAPAPHDPPDTAPAPPLLPVPGAPSASLQLNLPADSLSEESQLTRTLAQELARAAAQGLVDTDTVGQRAFDRQARESDLLPEHPAGGALIQHVDSASPEDEPEQGPGSMNIRIRTGVDRALASAAEHLAQAPAVSGCLPARTFAVPSWGDERPSHRQIAELRIQLVGEFDKPNLKAVAALAKLYIHLSFGAEARQIIEALGQDLPNRKALLALADLVDNDHPGSGLLASQMPCGGAAPLWALLAQPVNPPNYDVPTDTVLLSFAALPASLRRHLAPRLAARFAAANNHNAVDAVANSVALVAGKSDPALILTRVQGSREAGFDPATDKGLAELARTLHPEAAEALILHIEGRAEAGERISEDLVDTASIMAFELAGTPDGNRLKAIEIQARIVNGGYVRGFRELVRAVNSGTLGGTLLERTMDRALTQVIRDGSGNDVLRVAFDPQLEPLILASDSEQRRALADRVLDMGFGHRAAELAPDGDAVTDVVFSGRVARAKGDFSRAVRLADRSDDPEARRLLAQVLSESASYARAAEIYEELGEEELSLAESWRAADWQRIAAFGSSERRAAAQMLVSDQPILRDPTRHIPSLAETRNAVNSSSELRQTLTDLLQTLPKP